MPRFLDTLLKYNELRGCDWGFDLEASNLSLSAFAHSS